MRIVVDNIIPFAEEIFSPLGDIVAVETGQISPRHVRNADALVIRSETRVTAELLEGSRVRFVGSATIGTDHVDRKHLASRKIRFVNAPGSNATAVAEYIFAALLVWARRYGTSLRGKTLGIVGLGNIGSRVALRAEAIGLQVLRNDPPLARSLPGGKRAGSSKIFLPLDELMGADFLTIHVPLTSGGPDPTFHLFDAARIGRMRRGAFLINTSRGPVVDGTALKDALRSNHLAGACIDVWEGEPEIDVELLESVFLGTPHIAGYSLDGKLNAVLAVARELSSFLGGNPADVRVPDLPPSNIASLDFSEREEPAEALAGDAVTMCYDIVRDDNEFREIARVPRDQRRAFFLRMRLAYPPRREFRATTVTTSPEQGDLTQALQGLGFRTAQSQ